MLGAILDSFMGIGNWAQDEDAAAQTRSFNSAEAQRNREWTEDMSKTQYQRATADMKAAGLNPMLAYHQGGAGTPSGATASTSSTRTPLHGNIQAGLQSASQVALNDALTAKTNAEASKVTAEEGEIKARTPTHAVSIDKMQQQIQESKTLINKMIQETSTSAYSAANIEQQTKNLQALLPQINATIQHLRAQADLAETHEKQAITQMDQIRAQTGLTTQQTREIAQRIKQNLPEIERAVRDLEAKARALEMPRRGMDAAANQSFLGALGAVLRALNPLSTLTNIR